MVRLWILKVIPSPMRTSQSITCLIIRKRQKTEDGCWMVPQWISQAWPFELITRDSLGAFTRCRIAGFPHLNSAV